MRTSFDTYIFEELWIKKSANSIGKSGHKEGWKQYIYKLYGRLVRLELK